MDEVAQPIESGETKASEADAPPMGGETKAMIKALLKEYPALDQMQAETLVWGWETNNLGVLQEK